LLFGRRFDVGLKKILSVLPTNPNAAKRFLNFSHTNRSVFRFVSALLSKNWL